MTLWERIKNCIAQPEPEDSFLAPDTSPPIPDSLFIPGDTTRYAIPMPGEEHGRTDPHDKR